MVVEGADRFGLAQLHQLRGRVGRGGVASYCALVSEAAPSTAAWEDLVAGRRAPETTEQARLVAVARTLDGFELAEADFELRREGDVLGLAQSGLPRLRVASLQRADHRDARGRRPAPRRGAARRGRRAARSGPRAPPSRARRRLAGGDRRRRAGERGMSAPAIRAASSRPGWTAGVADAGRVIAGSARGRRLVAPGEGTRPLADRVKQTLFAILEPDLAGCRVPRPVRRERGGRDRGAVARRGAGDVRRAGPARGDDDRREPRPDRAGRTERPDRPHRRHSWLAASAPGRRGRPGDPAGAVRPRRRRPAVRRAGPPRARSWRSSARTGAGACSRPGRGSSPSTSGATVRRRRSGC